MVLTTENVSQKLSFQYWKDYVCDIFVQLEVKSQRERDFFGSIRNVSYGNTQFSEVNAHQQKVNRTSTTISKSIDDYFLLSMQLEGQGRIEQDGKVAFLGKNDMCLYDSTRPYSLEFDDAFKQLVLRIPRNFAYGLISKSTDITAQKIVTSSGIGKILFDHYLNIYHEQELLNEDMSTNIDSIGVNLLQLYFNQKSELKEDQDIMFLRVKNWIDKHIFTTDFTVSDIAKELNCSRRLIYKVFESQDQTPLAYMQWKRLEFAKEMLENPLNDHITVKEIAQISGFQNAGHFTSLFNKKYACTPKKYRHTR